MDTNILDVYKKLDIIREGFDLHFSGERSFSEDDLECVYENICDALDIIRDEIPDWEDL